ncbi:MAG: MFS transporter [Pseudomonadota bacterium]|nr:MFS transporter [Pseudomonadota bacterium]
MPASSSTPRFSVPILVLIVFMPFAGGFFLSYVYRSVNAVIAPQLAVDLGLSPADLGFLTSVYFMTFAASQLPLGVLLDRFGPRRVQAYLLFCAAAGAFIFAVGSDFTAVAIGRAIIGFGVCGGLMASFKAITLWFPPRSWPLVNGCFLTMGGLGAMAATVPLELVLNVIGWREVFALMAGLTVIAGGMILISVPERDDAPAPVPVGDQIKGYATIFTDRRFWSIVPCTVAAMATNFAVQGLWAGPWLRDVAGLDRQGVAEYLFVLTVAMMVGSTVNGMVAVWLERRGIPLIATIITLLLCYLTAQACLVLQIAPLSLLPWIGFGFFSNGTVLSYPLLNRLFPLAFSGRVSTAINVLGFGMAFILQYGIGAIIDLWPSTVDGYAAPGYLYALGAVWLVQVAGLLWFLVTWFGLSWRGVSTRDLASEAR